MHKISLIVGMIGLLYVNPLQSQDIRLMRDTVFLDDMPYAVFQSLGTVTKQMYSIKNLNGEPLILIDQSQLRDAEGNALMRFMFTDFPDKKAFMPVSLQFRRKMMRTLVAYNLIQKGTLNEKSLELFCKQYPGYFETNRIQAYQEPSNTSSVRSSNDLTNRNSSNPSTDSPAELNKTPSVVENNNLQAFDTTAIAQIDAPLPQKKIEPQTLQSINEEKEVLVNYSIVNRDIDQPIYLDGNVIRQDFEEVGLYTVEQVKPDGGLPYYIVSIYDIRHDFVAEALVPSNDKIFEFKTFKDGKTRKANIPEGDIYETVKQCASVLSHLLYL